MENLVLMKNSIVRAKRICTTKFGTETSSSLGPNLSNLVPNEYKTITSDSEVKNKSIGPIEPPLYVMQKLYSANSFLFSSSYDNFIVNVSM